MTDRAQRLREAARTRHDRTLHRAEDALRRLASRGDAVTYRRVAEVAGVSRSWLYSQPALRQQIDQLRGRPAGDSKRLPTSERATDDSLRQQVQTCREEVKRLRAENHALHEQLARRLGTDRAAAATRPS